MGPLLEVALDPATLPMVLGIKGRKWLDHPPFRHILHPSIDTMGRYSVFQRDLVRAGFNLFCSVADEVMGGRPPWLLPFRQ